ncbi:transcriptional regulator [Kaistia sp. 32K]|uniref:LacI family DNA-binding transcriptional regulator n=1 Tax=Kaistia sp. 32K TaxID=2795690 RepID=UPI0019169594|nr:LacI family DNA-binding transcriptional regulator [Kaistia sp. 32K]BCP52257.1 transcriptional regulator [Kaistia sp. 32K]
MSERRDTRVRSIDVARLAGVSRSAVSRTFTPNAYVSPETRSKVLKAAAALNYHPNAMARSLITQRSGIIGIVSADLQNPYYAKILEVLGGALRDTGLAPLVLFGDETSSKSQVAQLLSYQVDALVIINAVTSTLTENISRMKVPVVAVNRYFRHDWVTSITCDNQHAAELVGNHLLDQGCTRIGLVAGNSDASSGTDRETGFLRALAKRGVAPVVVENGDYTHDSGVAIARKLFGSGASMDAIFCCNDLMAIGLMDVARSEFGLRVPDDLLVAGFDNSVVGAWQSYRLTSVDQNVEQMVELAVHYIQRALEDDGKEAGQFFQVQGKLVVRESTGRSH